MTVKRVMNLAMYMAHTQQEQHVAELTGNDTADMTDDQIIERLRVRFKVLDDMTTATKMGIVRAMIVSGAAGVGKSYGVEAVLGQQGAEKDELKYEFVKGKISPLMLYSKLYEYRDEGSVVVFDDCDSVLEDDTSINILKAALDSSDVRTINWNTTSKFLSTNDLPTSFDFAGAVIFITNTKFDSSKSTKLAPHLAAIESRCHYLDLTIDTLREKMLRIRQIVSDGMLEKYCFAAETEAEIIDFVDNNKHNIRGLSLRTVLKVADLRAAFPDTWQDMALITCMRNN
jgi:hypothetical protein